MAMKRCPVCGEKYSDTYRDCPFCEEEIALRQGERIRRSGGRGGRRAVQQSGPSLLSPVLILLIVLMAALLVYLLFGDAIAERLGGEPSPGVEEVTPQPPAVGEDDTLPTEGEEPEDTGEPVTGQPEMDYATAAALPVGLTLSTTDFSLFNPGENHTITVSGGNGNYQWFSQDDGVASVDENGRVVAVSRGDINVVVTDGERQGTCVVRVRIASAAAPATAPTTTPETTPAQAPSTRAALNLTDFTLRVGDPDVQLRVSGVTTAITWTSSAPAVATVSSAGAVKAVSRGNATITASWDGQSLTCIVRVPG